MKKNKLIAIVFFMNDNTKKWHTDKFDLEKGLKPFLNRKYPNWLYLNLYDKKTREFKRRIYKRDV